MYMYNYTETIIPVLGKWRQGDQKFKVILDYIINLRPARLHRPWFKKVTKKINLCKSKDTVKKMEKPIELEEIL